jgi:hypothetical protein
MTEQPQNRVREDIYLARVLTVMADRVSAGFGSFSSWMIAGYGAALGLLVAHIDTVKDFVSPRSISWSIIFFLVAVVLNIFARYLAFMVAVSVAVGKEVETIQLPNPPVPNPLDFQYILSQMEQAIWWPQRIIVQWSNARIRAGDVSIAGRRNLKIAQIQAWLACLQVLLLVAAAAVIAGALYANP